MPSFIVPSFTLNWFNQWIACFLNIIVISCVDFEQSKSPNLIARFIYLFIFTLHDCSMAKFLICNLKPHQVFVVLTAFLSFSLSLSLSLGTQDSQCPTFDFHLFDIFASNHSQMTLFWHCLSKAKKKKQRWCCLLKTVQNNDHLNNTPP